jgi:copper chaperone
MNKNTFKFKTNINCDGCIARVTPLLNNKEGIEVWEVDINDPEKILTVESGTLNPSDIIKEVKKAGFTIEEILKPGIPDFS